jgi:hypothetical protein
MDMSNRRRPSRPTPPDPTSARRLTPEQLNKIQRDWRCAHCPADPPLTIRACPDCPPAGLYFRHEATCPVHRGLVSGAGNIARALAS